jgi:uncharacterized protein
VQELRFSLSRAMLRRIFLCSLCLFLAGCRQEPKPLTAQQIRALTREFVLAARNASNGAAQTGMDPERYPNAAAATRGQPAGAATPGASRSSVANPTPSADLIFITVPERDPQARQQMVDAIDQELEHVAQAHGLHRAPRAGTNGVIRFDYYYGSERTHRIHIILPLVVAPPPQVVSAASRQPKLAVIVDDLGYDRSAADALLQVPFPITFSVLPLLPHSSEIAEEAFRRGYQVILHLPLESETGGQSESVQLEPGMPLDQVALIFESMLETVPHAVGVNNHQGSRGTSDATLMDELMPALHDRELFFVDSRTSAATVAFDAARRAHVPAASRDIFLDDTPQVAAINRQLQLAARDARLHGEAIAIGHPHPETLEALIETLPQLEREGIALVFASQVVH